MKRITFILAAIIFCSLGCYAQLGKFEGTWVSKDTQMYVDMDSNEHPHAERVATIRIDVNGKDVHLRKKIYYRFSETGEESTSYFPVKNIVFNADSTITCDIYSPPEMGKTYIGKRTPHNLQYDKLVEHWKYKLKIESVVLMVEFGPTIRDFYSNGKLVESDCYPEENTVHRIEYYNEKDNW